MYIDVTADQVFFGGGLNIIITVSTQILLDDPAIFMKYQFLHQMFFTNIFRGRKPLSCLHLSYYVVLRIHSKILSLESECFILDFILLAQHTYRLIR